ncbi:MAG: YqgE/AlgH family protein [Flavobacteriales bacterium]
MKIIKKGNLLFSEPSIIGDINFNRSVVLIANHTDMGSVGFILNKKINYTTSELIPELKYEFLIFNGGPVEKENLYFIHCLPEIIPDSLKIKNNIYWGGDFNRVIKLINNGKIKENQIKFFLGYSGWEESQLENEIDTSSWILQENEISENLVFNNGDNIWKEKLIDLGGEYLIWSNSPENPNHN